MSLASARRHGFWAADVRYVDDHKLGGRTYLVSVWEKPLLKRRRSLRGGEDPAEPSLFASLELIGDTKAPRRLHTYGRSFRAALASLASVKRADGMATGAWRAEIVPVILLWRGKPVHQESSPGWKASGQERNRGEARIQSPFPRAGNLWTLRGAVCPRFFRSGTPFVSNSSRSRCLPPRATRAGLKDKLFPGSRDRIPTFGACVVTKDRVHEVGNLPHCLLETVR